MSVSVSECRHVFELTWFMGGLTFAFVMMHSLAKSNRAQPTSGGHFAFLHMICTIMSWSVSSSSITASRREY